MNLLAKLVGFFKGTKPKRDKVTSGFIKYVPKTPNQHKASRYAGLQKHDTWHRKLKPVFSLPFVIPKRKSAFAMKHANQGHVCRYKTVSKATGVYQCRTCGGKQYYTRKAIA